MRQRNNSGSKSSGECHIGPLHMTERMRFRPFKTIELVLLLLVLWAVCTFVLWRVRGPCPVPDPSDCAGVFPDINSRIRPRPHPGNSRQVPISPVYIVEEHHEVLKYWYHAAEKGMIPTKGNIVLHIDGHSDGATPFEWQKVPFFRLPRNPWEVTKMMQQNDVFIVAAAITGLINRYIWVWPPWDTSDGEHPDQIDYVRMDVKAGSTLKNVKGQMEKELCACTTVDTKVDCFMNNVTTDSDEEGGIPIEESACTIRSEGVIEIVSERRAIAMMKSGTWLTPQDNIILDIDEDYYGCEAAVLPLYDSGLAETEVRDISMWVQLLACVRGTTDERKVDNFYNSVLQTIIDYKKFCASGEMKPEACKPDAFRDIFWAMVPDLLNELKGRIEGKFCKQNPKFILKMLLAKLVSLTTEQLRALSEVGVCLNMSPKTLEFSYKENMRVCDGYNRPNETMVVFHTPDMKEIVDRTEYLKLILDGKKFKPAVTTICRSVRDGYTPKQFFHKIEADVLDVLKSSFSDINENHIFYDKDLLGGPVGWYGRHL